MSWSFIYVHNGTAYEGGWEINHGMIWLSFRGHTAFTKCGNTFDESVRNRDNAIHQLLVQEGLADTIPGQANVPIKLGWN